MPKINALLVEDDLETQVKISNMLESMGYTVVSFGDAGSARGYQDHDQVVDLVVLDRNIPYSAGGVDSSKVGDELLDFMWGKYADSAFIVFTGNADLESVYHALRERGTFTLGEGIEIERVQHFTKLETRKFRDAAMRLAQHFESLSSVEVIAAAPSHAESRALRRVARHFQGESVTAEKLEGGSTTDQVWKCRVAVGMTPVADVVVKIGKQTPAIGSFQALLPASTLIARSIVTLSGLMAGRIATIYSSAGEVTGSLHDEIEQRPHRAAKFVRDVARGLEVIVEPRSQVVRLESLVVPYIPWEKLEERVSSLGLTPPSPSLPVTSRIYAQHGDLHPGNVLICGKQAILIDLDSQVMGSGLIDPIALFWGAFFNKNSKIQGNAWPSEALCLSFPATTDSASLSASLQSCDYSEWVLAAWEWLGSRTASPREYWALTLAFAARQLKYLDVQNCPVQKRRAEALVERSVIALAS